MRLAIDMGELHKPVLANELVAALSLHEGDIAVDCTFGAGGHAAMVADQIGSSGQLIAVDRDSDTEAEFTRFAQQVSCETKFIAADFVTALKQLIGEGLRAKAVYLDLGISSMQIDRRERGFSYAWDAPLDMRMDHSQKLTAAQIVNEWPERRLASILKLYGEERYAQQIAKAIARERSRSPIATTGVLVEIVKKAVPTPARFAAGHPAKRVFQALRIAVNNELELLEQALPLAWQLLAPDGVLAVISFHSLEDRRVKKFLRDLARDCICPPELPVCTCGKVAEAELVGPKLTVPSADEIEENPRARSAKLRAARKLRGVGET